MNEDVLKPFVCKVADCDANFFTEDHLSVHQQAKHNKLLNLEIPKGSVLAFGDQTPTPTRLLNNCEELRVFDDLQNINPFEASFEEGFRRATEDGNNTHTLSTPSSQDTLHTPQILPQFEPRPVKSESPVQVKRSTSPTEVGTLSNIPTSNDLKVCADNINQLMHKHILPKPSIIYATPLITAPAIRENSLVDNGKSSVKDKLKNILLNNNATQSDKKRIKTELPTIIIGTVPLVTALDGSSLVITSSKVSNDSNQTASQTITPQKTSNTVNRKRTRDDKPEAITLKVERNRAAAKRYRNKMKIQGQALQDKYEKSQREILNLKKELADTWKELAHVKSILLLHKDCPVTRAQTTGPQADQNF